MYSISNKYECIKTFTYNDERYNILGTYQRNGIHNDNNHCIKSQYYYYYHQRSFFHSKRKKNIITL